MVHPMAVYGIEDNSGILTYIDRLASWKTQQFKITLNNLSSFQLFWFSFVEILILFHNNYKGLLDQLKMFLPESSQIFLFFFCFETDNIDSISHQLLVPLNFKILTQFVNILLGLSEL